MNQPRRHDLIEISELGRENAFAEIVGSFDLEQQGMVRQLIVGNADTPKIPGIARREEGMPRPGMIPIGFSSPYRVEGNRLRIAAFVSPQNVTAVVSPHEVLCRPFVARTPCLKALADISAVARSMALEMGVWGSTALEIYTGLPYTDERSDLDLLIDVTSMEVIRRFGDGVSETGRRWNCKVDVEMNLPSGYGVKLAELLMSTDSVLAKGLQDVVLLPKQEILSLMAEVQSKNDMEE